MKHPNTEKFSLRRQFLNEYNGQLMFRSVHFPIHISNIVKECWFRCSKNIFQEFPNNINTSEPDESKLENMKNNLILEKSKADEKSVQAMIRSKNFWKKQTKCLKSQEGVMTLRLYYRHFQMEH